MSNYTINYDDERFKGVEEEKNTALNQVNNAYNQMINSSDQFYQAQQDAVNDYKNQQTQLQQQQTDFTDLSVRDYVGSNGIVAAISSIIRKLTNVGDSIVIQSPGRSMSFIDSCTPATSPIIVSLKTSIRIAAEAPNPAIIFTGSLSINVLTIIITPIQITTSLSIW